MFKRLKGVAVGCAALALASTALFAAGNWSTLPIIGGASYCASTVSGTGSLSGVTGSGQGTTGSLCAQTVPAGPTILTGAEVVPVDLFTPGAAAAALGGQPATAVLPIISIANGYGGTTVSSTTGTTAAVLAADGISNYIYSGAGAATYTSFKLPANPITNQTFCLANAGSGILTLTAVAAAANSFGNTPTVTGVTPTSLPVMTAVGTAGTVTLGKNCWLYVAGASNTGVWYRTL